MKRQWLLGLLILFSSSYIHAQNTPFEEPTSEQVFNQILAAQTFKEAARLASQKITVYVLDSRVGESLDLPVLSNSDLEKTGLLPIGLSQHEVEHCALFLPEINAIVIHGTENYKQEVLAREFFVAEIFNHLPQSFLENFEKKPTDAPEEEMRRIAESIARLNFLLFDIVARSHDVSPADFASDVSFHFSEISESINELVSLGWSTNMVRCYLSLVIQTTQRVFREYACRHITDDILKLTEDDNARIQLLKKESLESWLQLRHYRGNLRTALTEIEWQGPEEITQPFTYISERRDAAFSPDALFHHIKTALGDSTLSELELKTVQALVKLYAFHHDLLTHASPKKLQINLSQGVSCFNEAVFGWDIYANAENLQRFREFITRIEKIIKGAFLTLPIKTSILEIATRYTQIKLDSKARDRTNWRLQFSDFQRHTLVVLGKLDPSAVSQPITTDEASALRERIQEAIRREGARINLPRASEEEPGKQPDLRNRIQRFFDGEGPRDIRPHR